LPVKGAKESGSIEQVLIGRWRLLFPVQDDITDEEPYMADPSDDLNTRLKATAEKKIGGKALTSKFGTDCFALVDALLRSLNANSAHDYDDEVPVTEDAHYKWGDEIMLDSIKAGDILQFQNHEVETHTRTDMEDGEWKEESRTQHRPHHTAIVIEVLKDGGVVVVEQNVRPHPNKVTRNVILRLADGEETRHESKRKKTDIKVKGKVSAYRPVRKPKKGASLLRPRETMLSGGRRMLASAVPAQGGAKRPPGPIGRG
jgi:hypothetical protein